LERLGALDKLDKIVNERRSLLPGATGDSIKLSVGNSTFFIGARRRTDLYCLPRLRISCLLALAIKIRADGKFSLVAGSTMSVCEPT